MTQIDLHTVGWAGLAHHRLAVENESHFGNGLAAADGFYAEPIGMQLVGGTQDLEGVLFEEFTKFTLR